MSPETEGTILFFPSRLNHTVYPFYQCEEDRITISGNVSFDADDAFPKQSEEDPTPDVKKTTPSEWLDWNKPQEDSNEFKFKKHHEASEEKKNSDNSDKKWWTSEVSNVKW